MESGEFFIQIINLVIKKPNKIFRHFLKRNCQKKKGTVIEAMMLFFPSPAAVPLILV